MIYIYLNILKYCNIFPMLFNIDISSDSNDSSYWEDDTFIECCCPVNKNKSKDMSKEIISKLNIKI